MYKADIESMYTLTARVKTTGTRSTVIFHTEDDANTYMDICKSPSSDIEIIEKKPKLSFLLTNIKGYLLRS